MNSRNLSLSKTNTSGRKGVSFNKSKQKYEAYVHRSGKKVYLGSYKHLEDANAAVDEYNLQSQPKGGNQLDIDKAKIRFAYTRDKKEGLESN